MNKNNNRKNRNNWRVNPTDKALELLGLYQETLCLGFSDENWTRATRILNDMSRHVDLETRHELGSVMALAYSDPTIQNVIVICERIANKLQAKTL